jgi:uncharacterized membrane protein HdeD (DUF308 family)
LTDRTGRILVAALGVASIAVGLSLLAGLRTLASTAASYVVGMTGVLCGALLLRIAIGVKRGR